MFDPSDERTFDSDVIRVRLQGAQLIAAGAAIAAVVAAGLWTIPRGNQLGALLTFPPITIGLAIWLVICTVGALVRRASLAATLLTICITIEIAVFGLPGLLLMRAPMNAVLFIGFVLANVVAIGAVGHLFKGSRRDALSEPPDPRLQILDDGRGERPPVVSIGAVQGPRSGSEPVLDADRDVLRQLLEDA